METKYINYGEAYRCAIYLQSVFFRPPEEWRGYANCVLDFLLENFSFGHPGVSFEESQELLDFFGETRVPVWRLILLMKRGEGSPRIRRIAFRAEAYSWGRFTSRTNEEIDALDPESIGCPYPSGSFGQVRIEKARALLATEEWALSPAGKRERAD